MRVWEWRGIGTDCPVVVDKIRIELGIAKIDLQNNPSQAIFLYIFMTSFWRENNYCTDQPGLNGYYAIFVPQLTYLRVLSLRYNAIQICVQNSLYLCALSKLL